MHRFHIACGPLSQKLLRWTVLLYSLACIVSTAKALDPHKRLNQYRKQTWQIDNGLPQNTVHAVLQSRDGFIWLATEGGLVRFDGVDFRVFDTSNTPAFQSNVVDALMEDRNGNLWISTSDGLLRLSQGRFTAFTTANGLPSNAVMSVSQLKDGKLIVATAMGLAISKGEAFEELAGMEQIANTGQVILLADDSTQRLWVAAGQQIITLHVGSSTEHLVSPQVGTIQAIASDGHGNIWIGGTRGLRCFGPATQCGKNGKMANVLLPSRSVTSLLSGARAAGPDEMWIGTTAGLARFSKGTLQEIGAQEGLAKADIRKLFMDRAGALWVMASGTMARIVEGRVDLVPRETGIGDVLSVLEDSDGDLWFGSESGGVSVFRDQMFSSISMHHGPTAEYARTVFQDSAGTIWVGTNGGGVYRLLEGKASLLQPSGGLSSNVILSMAETGGDLWVGTPDGLIRIHDGKSQLISVTNGLVDNFVRSLYADVDGSLWIGTRNGLTHLHDGKFQSYFARDGLGSDVIGSVLRTRAGELWVATLGGLSRLSGNRFVNYTSHDGLGGDAVTALFEDAEGFLWIGTNGSGLNCLRNGHFTWVSPAKTSIPKTVYGILQDKNDNLWLSSEKGIYRVSTKNLKEYANKGKGEIFVDHFGAADGMQISEGSSGGHPAAWRMKDGTLWFATPKGVAWVDPMASSATIHTPRVVIEEISINNDVIEPLKATGSELIVAPGRERITIHYAGLHFQAPQKVRYKYMLEGFDRGWGPTGVGRTAYYTNLPPGHYTFRVVASTMDGVWSEPTSIQFRVQPTFFQTRWFYLLMGLLVVAIGYIAYRVRIHYVEATYRAVMAERGRIAREVHDTLAQGYVGMSVQLEIASQLLRNSQNSSDAVLGQLQEMKEFVRNGLSEARSSIWELRSEGDSKDILPSRIAIAARLRTRTDGPPVSFQVHGTYRPLAREIEDQILRIAQEAVSNTVRHANAERVEITLTYDVKTIVLCIRDNGRGFLESQNSFASGGHFGLQGMHERALSIGAILQVDGHEGKGTDVILTLDVEQEIGKDA